MRKLLLGLGVAATAVAVKKSGDSDQDDTGTRAEGAEIDLTDGAGTTSPAPRSGSDATSARRAGASSSAAEARQQREGADGQRGGGDRGQQADRPGEISKAGWKDIAKRTLAEVKADRVPMMAAAVAFAGLLALFPAMIAAISIYGLVIDPATAASHAEDLTAALPEEAAGLIGSQLDTIAGGEPETLGIALVVSILAALWSASGGMGMLLNALNVAYDEEDQRGFIKKRGLAILLTLGALVFVAVTITLIAVVPPVLDNLGLGTVGTIAAQAARWALLAVLIAVALAVLFRVGPHREDAEWSWISPGAIVAGVLWLLGSLAFSFFVNNFGSYNETYGTVSGVIVLMLWLQLSALIVLLGAEMNAEMERQTVHDTTTGPSAPIGQRGAEPADSMPPPPEDASDQEDQEVARA